MKKINIAILLSCIVLVASCTKDLTGLNNDPKNPPLVPSYTLFTNAEKYLARTQASSNVNLNIFRLISQQWQEVTYTSESRYSLNGRNIPSNFWAGFYRDVLEDMQSARSLIPSDVTGAGKQTNELATLD